MESAIEKVADDPDAAEGQPGKNQRGVGKVKQKARACLQEMVANVSPAFIRSFSLGFIGDAGFYRYPSLR